LFEREHQANRATVALRTSAEGLRAWQAHLSTFPEIKVTFEDHQVAVSIYFSDPDENPYEIHYCPVKRASQRRFASIGAG
jgi:catechol-2,3-dioxygenase